jgi:hypothetical protein
LLPATAAASTNGHDDKEEDTCIGAAEVNAVTSKLGFTKQKAQD